jgi:hypothetical protein
VPWTGASPAPLAWRIEKEPSSQATLRSGPEGAVVEYRLGGDRSRSPYVAVASDLHGARFSAIEAALTSSRPMRVSVQVRAGDGARWGQSVYVDSSNRLYRIPLASMRSMDGGSGAPSAASIDSALLVVDLTNAVPSGAGAFIIRSLAAVR